MPFRRPLARRPLPRLGQVLTRLGLIALAAVPLACTSVFPVAVLIPESGDGQAYGEAVRRGVELALTELRESGQGSHLQVTFHDTQSQPGVASETLDTLFGGDTLVAIGGITPDETAVLVEVAEKHQRVLLSPLSGDELLSQDAPHFYRLAVSDLTAGSTMADFSRRELEVGNALLMADRADLLESLELGFRSTFESAGGYIVDVLEAPADDAELKALLEAQTVDAVFVDGTPGGLVDLIQRLRRAGFEGKILTTQTLAAPAVIRSLGEAAEDVLLTKSVLEDDGTKPRTAAFIQSYQDAYGEAPSVFAAQAYDAVFVLAMALEGRPAIPSSVRKGLRDNVKDYTGASGMIQFSSGGSINRYPRVYRIAEDLSLVDHAQELRLEREEKERRRKELLAQLNNIRNQGVDNDSEADRATGNDSDDDDDETALSGR